MRAIGGKNVPLGSRNWAPSGVHSLARPLLLQFPLQFQFAAISLNTKHWRLPKSESTSCRRRRHRRWRGGGGAIVAVRGRNCVCVCVCIRGLQQQQQQQQRPPPQTARPFERDRSRHASIRERMLSLDDNHSDWFGPLGTCITWRVFARARGLNLFVSPLCPINRCFFPLFLPPSLSIYLSGRQDQTERERKGSVLTLRLQTCRALIAPTTPVPCLSTWHSGQLISLASPPLLFSRWSLYIRADVRCA